MKNFKNIFFGLLALVSIAAHSARVVQVDELRANTAGAALLATSTQLGYLAGVTGNIQAQINAASGGGSSFNPLTSTSLFEDFLSFNPGSGANSLPWPRSAVGAGSAVGPVSPGAGFDTEVPLNYPGVVRLETGTTSTGSAKLFSADTPYSFVYGYGAIDLKQNVKIPVAISAGVEEFTVQVGLMTEFYFSAPDAEGAYFQYSPASANWFCITKNSATATSTDSGIPVITGSGDTFQSLRIVSNTAATSIQFYVNGVLGCTNTTNLPTGVNTFGDQIVLHITWAILKTLGTTERVIYADYAYLTQALTRQ